MTNTYTFTARDGVESEKSLTLTLGTEYVRINLTGLLDQMGKIAAAENTPDEAADQLIKQASPAVLKLLETISGPVHIKDFSASLDDEAFSIKIWQRLRSLRLAPVSLTIDPVDNLDAARAFIAELEERKNEASRVSRFPGILDYWFTWTGMILGVLALILWPQKKQPSEG